jgi:hypothetical protein
MKNVVVGVETFADDRITKSTDLHSDEADNKTDSTPAIVQPRLVVVVGRHECQQLREALAGSAFLDGQGQRPIVSSYGPTTVSISINGRAKADPERLQNILAAFPEAKLEFLTTVFWISKLYHRCIFDFRTILKTVKSTTDTFV